MDMAGSSFGKLFRVTTFGESHGRGIGAVIDGCPPRIRLSAEDFVLEMSRRRFSDHRAHTTPRRERDRVEILSGVFEGKTTGTPLALFIANNDVDSPPYEILRHLVRPGHGDYTFFKKYGHFDFRGGGRYSARETAARVAAGVVAHKVIEPLDMKVVAYTIELGGIRAETPELETIRKSPVGCPDPAESKRMLEILSQAAKEVDTLGVIA